MLLNKDINTYTSAIHFLIGCNRIRFNLKHIRINLAPWGFLHRITCGLEVLAQEVLHAF